MDRLEQRLSDVRAAGRPGLVSFVMAGDPSPADSVPILHALVEGGADVLELGMSFSDPMADGPAIQAAGERALAAGMTLRGVLDIVREFRQKDRAAPVILMGYLNPLEQYGVEAFCRDAKAAGVDGLIIVDVPYEESADILPHLQGLHWIRLIAPTTSAERLQPLLAAASGFVYYISIAGITGTATASRTALAAGVERIRGVSQLPVAAGFGIKTAEQVKEAGELADLVVVGSALVDAIYQASQRGLSAHEAARTAIRAMIPDGWQRNSENHSSAA